MRAFEKWQGLGNDFIVIDGDDPGAALARALCDRRRGIGGDGVLALAEQADGVRMIVRNADGSRPEMCGNGVRCVVGAVAARRGLDAGELVVLSDAGPRRCGFSRAAEGSFLVSVAMGRARLEGPVTHPATPGFGFVRVDMGNPHAVSFDPFVDADLDVVGPALERGTPLGINVELCRVVHPRRIEVVVWERGCGRTQACGTGACAVLAAAIDGGHATAGEPVEVVLPGGALTIVVERTTFAVTMTGPATFVFRGGIDG
ncbi:MAG: diaminopimelate epimerase [Deltaproteobacteria bacterium]|nr:diaminopimelate epimerase [Deltaproteobacteria bacterium]